MPQPTPRPAKLALADGTVFTGEHFGAPGEAYGEAVFNTSLTGYQEILTDPSYAGQIVAMTYPEIGNYGVNADDVESKGIAARGFVVRELCRRPSNFRSEKSLSAYLEEAGVVGISGVDTRALVRTLRSAGAMTAVISTETLDDAALVEKARNSPDLVGQDLIKTVMPDAAQEWAEPLHEFAAPSSAAATPGHVPHVVAIDYGMKWNIPRHLAAMGCKVTVLPGTVTAAEVKAHKPDGIFLSNGPGDPRPLDYAVGTIRELLEDGVPIFGICLGQQLLGLACGGEIEKLKFGHRGANQPVLEKATGRVEITSQNHGFALKADTLPADVEVTHVNLNDDTVSGIRHKTRPAFAVQYHPEASAGPHDSGHLFARFREMMTKA
ncbi:glutamine-hydrolyzing carbamoyl-phosphate synthase small subunit [Alienimonas californiensis]|uniref:Carbamoyl phosphate synthase small chain n=1 Tax=Alienimonas californiensis TaxID=2527989 RepID=A0A517PF53_9PLAN|nr:glutamine-hydrolyzing carbamoyl-phosphate synthase small subunit [Alienimonas californiensis]QDT17999.1 Carbamoyl-phosphate synthase small chain [Alienimonas californiensis]